VVDDIASNRTVLVDLLAPLGFAVIEATDGQQALDLAQDTKPDIILMDRRMPVMDGLMAAQQIRQILELAAIPIISVSASVSDEDQVMSLEAGYDAFLPKPIQWPLMAALLEKHLKLEWIYAETQNEGLTRGQTTPDVTAPPQDELEHLLELALRGDMRGIRERTTHLETLDARYTAFARSLHDLAKEFERQQILALIRQHLGEKR
jgi:CheY-like chemotaxis protein